MSLLLKINDNSFLIWKNLAPENEPLGWKYARWKKKVKTEIH